MQEQQGDLELGNIKQSLDSIKICSANISKTQMKGMYALTQLITYPSIVHGFICIKRHIIYVIFFWPEFREAFGFFDKVRFFVSNNFFI